MPTPLTHVLRRLLERSLGLVLVAGLTLGFVHLHYGISFGLDGVSRPVPLGTPPRVATGLGSFDYMVRQPDDRAQPVAYDPCRPIRYQVDADLAPRGADRVVTQAVAAVSRATGLVFEYDGPTDRLPSPDHASADRQPVVISWTTPAAVPGLAGPTVGLGGSTARSHPFADELEYVTGSVLLDTPALSELLGREGGDRLAQALVMHELGHLVGLAHVDARDELMAAENTGLLGFGPGDREGLALLGSGRCFP